MQKVESTSNQKRDKDALKAFLEQCKVVAKKKGKMQIASISLETKFMDPLAVLESIYEADQLHFYLEHPASEEAIAGAEAVVEASFSGPERFEQIHAFAKQVFDNTIMIGDMDAAFTGPHFFVSFTFFDKVREDAEFPAARVFLPRWQVACKDGVYSAVANVPVSSEGDTDQLVEKVWAAHQKFNAFEYEELSMGDRCAEILHSTEVGGEGWYQEAVKKALAGIDKGEYEKIVLARAVDLESDVPFDPLSSLNRLREQYPLCFPCSIANGKGQSFIAAAPERLLKVNNGRLFTEAVAGSAPRGKTSQEDAKYGKELLNSDKDLREHNFVCETIVKHLEALGINPMVSAKPRLKKLANVQHLNSLIEADLPKDVHILDVAKRIHPTPAVGGEPLDAALEGIYEIENFDRGLYAGALGWFNYKGEGELVVGIRSALINGNKARLYAGSGIVKGSDSEKERQETNVKIEAMMANLR